MRKLIILSLLISAFIMYLSFYVSAEEITNKSCNKNNPCSNGLVCVKFPDKQNPVCAVYPPSNYYSCPEGYVTQLKDPVADGQPFNVICLTQEEANANTCPTISAQCPGELIEEGKDERGCGKVKCGKILFNGIKSEIKIMPETASEKAIERLGEIGFNISLKEVGDDRIAYELTAEKQGKMFGLFKAKGKVSAEIDAETGEIIKIKKPWWAFLASGI